MAHTNEWSNIVPAGSDALNTADDQIRRLRLDIQERMDEVVDDWTADPVVPLKLDVSRISGTPDCARVHTNANPTASTTIALIIDFELEGFDPGNFHSNSVNPSRLKVVTAGYYLIHGQIEVAAPDTNASAGEIRILKNGSTIAINIVDHDSSLGAAALGYSVQTLDLAAVDDYYQVSFTQASGSTWTVQSGIDQSFFEIFRLAGTT